MIKFSECAESLSIRTDTQPELNLETLVRVQFILFSAFYSVTLHDDVKYIEKISVSEMFKWNIIIFLNK